MKFGNTLLGLYATYDVHLCFSAHLIKE